MDVIKSLSNVIAAGLIAIALVVSVVVIITRVDSGFGRLDWYIRNMAIHDCIVSSKTEMQADGQKMVEPNQVWFDKCMKEKGLR